ncbi:MAG: 3-deoxy-manno-octulosonate cytidylyltransferase [Bacteroidia bacterium]
MKIIAIIPARFGSSRFPGKPLALLSGKPVIQWVYEAAKRSASLNAVVVATDHADIYAQVRQFGGEAVLTGTHHLSGTDRCAEALLKSGKQFDAVINIQGDEPFIDPEQIDLLASLLKNPLVKIATLIQPLKDPKLLSDPNIVKVVINAKNEALYFSRTPIPFVRGQAHAAWMEKVQYFRHLGIYGFRSHILQQIVNLPPSKLEEAEALEQLRWLEHGYSIHTAMTSQDSLAIDTPEDLAKAEDFLRQNTSGS